MRHTILLAALLFAFPASAVVQFDWVWVGDRGNLADTEVMTTDGTTGYGSVAHEYKISRLEVSNAQYTEFLNAVAATDTHALYNIQMGYSYLGGISRSGSSGSYRYSAVTGRENNPVSRVSFYDALRFVNWLHNGQPTGAQDNSTTELGAYYITLRGIADNSIIRESGARVFLPSEDEWYKAAYYRGGVRDPGYWDFPIGSDTAPTCSAPTAEENSANCSVTFSGRGPTDVGSYTGSPSPSGTFDQGGNVFEWTEAVPFAFRRVVRGGDSIAMGQGRLAASYRGTSIAANDLARGGFRVASPVAPPNVPTYNIVWVTVGDPGNAADTEIMTTDGSTGYGSVAHEYRISKFEVSNTEYIEFLNAVAATDANALYNTNMGFFARGGGIKRYNTSEGYRYSIIAGFENRPVNYVSFYDALRFANWLHNGKPTGAQDTTTTERGAYTITPGGIAATSITRNSDARAFLASEDEWYKAAYYKGGATDAGYWNFPLGSDTAPTCSEPSAVANSANCSVTFLSRGSIEVGSYPGSTSPSGTFDQGGNVWEWTEAVAFAFRRVVRGGDSIPQGQGRLAASYRGTSLATVEQAGVGIRIASVTSLPEVPSLNATGIAVLCSLLALASWLKLRV